MATDPERRRRLLQHTVLAVIALAALLLRLHYAHTAVVIQPIRGDAVQYYAYAWNLIHHHVFSGALPHAATVVPDSFRDPGYPTFLALIAGTGDMEHGFVQHVLEAQSVLSAATVWVFAVLARRWAGFGVACATGLLLGLWPHTITLAGYVLSETLTGVLVAVALLLLDQMLRNGKSWAALAAGLTFALAALTNAVLAPFAPLLAAWRCWRDRDHRRLWAMLLVASLLPLAAWTLRGVALPGGQESSGDRARMNLVQGSWPEYHAAYAASFAHDAHAEAIMKAIGDDYDALRTSTSGGLARIGKRLAGEPLRYTGWYLSKPLELWGWNIGIGEGDIYVYETFRSPLSMNPALRGVTGVLFFLSPFVMLFAAIGVVLVFIPSVRAAPGLHASAMLGLWVTLVYGVLQSDARYATPFRGIEILLAVFTVHMAVVVLRRRKATKFATGRITS